MLDIKSTEPWRGRTFLISTRNIKLLNYCDRVIFMNNGAITYNGDCERFMQTEIYEDYTRLAPKRNQEIENLTQPVVS